MVQCRRVGDTGELSNTCQKLVNTALPTVAYLQLTRPKSLRRIVDKATSEVALHTTDHVVVLRVLPLATRLISLYLRNRLVQGT